MAPLTAASAKTLATSNVADRDIYLRIVEVAKVACGFAVKLMCWNAGAPSPIR
jgi:hypothetical protein